MTEEKHGKSLHKTDRKKCFRNRKIPEWLIKKRQAASAKCEKFQMKIGMAGKNTASGIRKMQKIPDENRDDGEKTRQAPAQDRQKRMLREPQNAGIADKFPPESSEKSGKIMDTERKISHTARKKLENDSKGEGKMPGNGKRKPKKTGFSFEKNSGKALKTRE